MTFSDDLKRFQRNVEDRLLAVFTGVVDLVHESIVDGSAVTGAPGQPVDTGRLRASWTKSFTGPTEASIGTNVEYAGVIEDGGNTRGPFTLRSAVGGFHSVKLTVAAWKAIVATVTQRVTGATA